MKEVGVKTKMVNIKLPWLIPFFIIGLEMLFHFEIYGSFDVYVLYASLLSMSFSFFVLLISTTKYQKWNKLIRCVLLFLAIVYYTVQIIYHQVFGNFLSLKSIFNGAGQAMDFGSTIWEAFLEHIGAIGIAVLAWVLYVVLEIKSFLPRGAKKTKMNSGYQKADSSSQKLMNAEQGNYIKVSQVITYLAIIVILPIIATIVLMLKGTEIGSTYDVKIRFHRTEQSMYRLGLMETLAKDIRENICDKLGITEKQANMFYLWIENTFIIKDVDNLAIESEDMISDEQRTESTNPTETKQIDYHVWDIDFNTLIQNTDNEELKDVHAYFASQEATMKNQYTGLFEGYNLIYITAESFSDVVIDKERTPMLYRMQQEGFQFENFYTPSWYLSTIDGEYVNCLGQIPVEGDWSLQHSAENVLSMALGNQLKEQGYVCNAYHNHDSYYYDRTITHPNMGYSFKAVGAGLTFESMYPESDLELMEITVDEYIGEEPFHTYYMTMSGHLPYTYDYNSMAVKNRDVIEGEEWSEEAACYLAANTELEYAIAYLVERLEKVGKLENTLFVIVPDHYPYGLKKGAYDELRGYEVESDEFEIYRNGCLIWSASMRNMEEVAFPVKVDKYCSNLDLLPTISNLLGLSYDSRLLAGRDMLSEEMGIVMFKDRSFLTDKVRYHATTGEVEWAAGQQEDSAYLEKCMEMVQNRFYYSAKVLQLDYMNNCAVQ